MRKNKDIPEGGAKGVVFLSLHAQSKGVVCFRKYIDALLDMLLPSDRIVDRNPERPPIVLFLGPDEGTAELMG